MHTSKILLLALLLFGSKCLRSQTLINLRCYFDDDTNTAQYINLNGQLDVDAPFTIDVSGLTKGVHTLYIETLNFDGKWSHYATRNVQIYGSMQMATLNLVEYYFDNEPADGSAITVALNGTSIDQTFDISVDGLSNGPHVLFTRVRDAGGDWSVYHSCRIYDFTGRMIAQMPPNGLLALDGWCNGVYTIQFIGSEHSFFERFEKID
jgi:hypothetical protein